MLRVFGLRVRSEEGPRHSAGERVGIAEHRHHVWHRRNRPEASLEFGLVQWTGSSRRRRLKAFAILCRGML
jgi:hypothetical protein